MDVPLVVVRKNFGVAIFGDEVVPTAIPDAGKVTEARVRTRPQIFFLVRRVPEEHECRDDSTDDEHQRDRKPPGQAQDAPRARHERDHLAQPGTQNAIALDNLRGRNSLVVGVRE